MSRNILGNTLLPLREKVAEALRRSDEGCAMLLSTGTAQ